MGGLSFEAEQEQALLIAELKAENKELEFELETLTMAKETVDRFLKERRQEVAKLLAENKALRESVKWYESAVEDGDGYFGSLAKANKELEAEVARLKDKVDDFEYPLRTTRNITVLQEVWDAREERLKKLEAENKALRELGSEAMKGLIPSVVHMGHRCNKYTIAYGANGIDPIRNFKALLQPPKESSSDE